MHLIEEKVEEESRCVIQTLLEGALRCDPRHFFDFYGCEREAIHLAVHIPSKSQMIQETYLTTCLTSCESPRTMDDFDGSSPSH